MRKFWFFLFYHAAPAYPPPNEAWEPPPAIVDEKPEEKAAIAPLGGNRDCTGVPADQRTLDCAFSHGQPVLCGVLDGTGPRRRFEAPCLGAAVAGALAWR